MAPSPVVVHTSPDLDCITGAWLLQRYGGLADHPVVFVNTAEPDPDLLATAAAVVDTGRCLDPGILRFDHHQDADLPCAAMLVYRALRSAGLAPDSLLPLVELVDAVDRGQAHDGRQTSVLLGIHALLGAFKRRSPGDDHGAYIYLRHLLDDLAAGLEARAGSREAVTDCLRWTSPDGLIVALDTTGRSDGATVTRMAGEVLGARLAVWVGAKTAGGRTLHSAGCQRLGGPDVDTPYVGELVERAVTFLAERGETDRSTWSLLRELSSWFRHPAGWIAMSGSDKAPRDRPVAVSAEALARALDQAWRR